MKYGYKSVRENSVESVEDIGFKINYLNQVFIANIYKRMFTDLSLNMTYYKIIEI